MMTLPATRKWTPEEYLAYEEQALDKSEYIDGHVVAMAGASPEHNTIVVNASAELRAQLRGTGCRHYTSDLRVHAAEGGLYTYPDLVVVCGEPRFDDGRRRNLVNPTLIIEILSPSTEEWDRGGKFERYQKLPSLREYILIAQDRPHVEQFLRHPDGRWDPAEVTVVDGVDGVAHLTSIGCTLRLAEVYDGVPFTAQEVEP